MELSSCNRFTPFGSAWSTQVERALRIEKCGVDSQIVFDGWIIDIDKSLAKSNSMACNAWVYMTFGSRRCGLILLVVIRSSGCSLLRMGAIVFVLCAHRKAIVIVMRRK